MLTRNNFLNTNEVVLILTMVEIVFLCVLLKLLATERKQPRNLLITFFLLIMGMLLTTLITWNSYMQSLPIAHMVIVPLIMTVTSLLQGPTLYFYLRSLSEEVNLWQRINLIHLVPSVVAAVVIVAFNVDIIKWLPWIPLSPFDRNVVRFIWAMLKCFPLVYVLICFYAEFRLRQQLRQVYSDISAKELLWADVVLGGFFIHWLWGFVAYFLGAYVSGETNDLLGILTNYFTVILVNIMFLYSLINTRQLLTLPQIEATKPVDLPPAEAKVDKDEKIAIIENGIHVQKLYLDTQINLERFSEQIGLKSREVSTILNNHYQSNFFEFINGYRVEEAKRLLASSECQQDTILDIIYKTGFNSQSAFHRFFKRVVGMTPSEFRAQQRKPAATE